MMRRLSSLALATAFIVSAGPAAAATWVLDTEHSTVGFAVKHMMVTDQKGGFDTFTGTIELDDKDITKSSVKVEIDTASVSTRNKKRDDHLRSPEFFDAAKFPKMTFESTKIEKSKDGGLTVTGNLKIRDISKPVTLTVAPLSAEFKDPWGGTHRGTTATATINREDFGLTWNKALEKGGVVVGKDVKIELQIELLPKPAPAPAAAAAPKK